MAVEAKADESFGETVAKTLVAAQTRAKVNPRSNGVVRLHQLRSAILGINPGDEIPDAGIRYQLITACAGALCEAERHNYSRSLMLVHEFITDKTDDVKHKCNADDLNDFVFQLSRGDISKVKSGVIYGPFTVRGTSILTRQVNLFIGKVSRNIRPTDG
ncbi:MAG: hypothetical protein Q7K03_02610 [Dehalococcoidia bacterium]|nr:hypothetical protein [Dehalococcoidia bacterium]